MNIGRRPWLLIRPARALADLQAQFHRLAVRGLPTFREGIRRSPYLSEALRQSARLRATHCSTRNEGNHLTLAEAEQAVMEGRRFSGRERDRKRPTSPA